MNQDKLHDLPPIKHRRSGLLWPGIVVLALSGGGFYFQYLSAAPEAKLVAEHGKHDRQHEEDTPVVVATETAEQTDFPVYLNGLGTVTALRTVTVKPRVDGELLRVTFTEGQLVNAGDVLAEIDPRPFQIQLQQAEGQLLRDEALLNNAQIDHARYQTLQQQDSIAAQQTDTQGAQVKQYRGNVEMDKAQVNNAKLQLSYAKLTAPISGQVGLRQIDQGNIVHANDAQGLVVITQVQPINVVFTLPEDKIQTVMQRRRSNQPIAIAAYDRAGATVLAEGKLLAIDNQIDPGTGTLKLKAQFANQDRTLFANQFVNIKMHLDTLAAAITVPSAAIQHDNQGAFVYVVSAEQTVRLRRVTLGPSSADQVVVLSNLAVHEQVVVDGVERLQEGAKVDVAKKDGQALAVRADHPNKDSVALLKPKRHS